MKEKRKAIDEDDFKILKLSWIRLIGKWLRMMFIVAQSRLNLEKGKGQSERNIRIPRGSKFS